MISLRLLTRNVTPQVTVSTQRLHTSNILFKFDSSSSDSSDDEKQIKKTAKNENAEEKEKPVHRLNSLLQSMTKESKTQSKVNVAVNPTKTNQPRHNFPRPSKNVAANRFEDKLTSAAKGVAVSFGGDINKTESELLKKILTPSSSDQQPINLSKLVMGMNIDRKTSTGPVVPSSRADQVRTEMERSNRYPPPKQQFDQKRTRERIRSHDMPTSARVDLDSGTPLNIFHVKDNVVVDPNTPTLSTWDLLENREHKLLVTHPPINFIQQQIRWTEQGRLWRFPIDNEQDLHLVPEEHFSEHIFLEQHLEGWCPTRGPIRHFMELVCVGLSKNPWMSAKDKRERIMWFKDYFDKKRDLLEELSVYGAKVNNPDQKQIQS